MKPNIKFLKKEQNIGKQIAIYCAGTHGLLFAQVLEKCQIKTDIFFDSNNNKWGEEIYEGIFCANPYKVADKNNYIVFICIAPDYYEETQKQVQSIGFQNIVNFNCILDDIILNMPLLYLLEFLEIMIRYVNHRYFQKILIIILFLIINQRI